MKKRIVPTLYQLGSVDLTPDQAHYIMKRGYNFLAVFPDGNFKPCFTRKHAQRVIFHWNIKNPTNKTCSLYSIVEISKIEPEKKERFLTRLLKTMFGMYNL